MNKLFKGVGGKFFTAVFIGKIAIGLLTTIVGIILAITLVIPVIKENIRAWEDQKAYIEQFRTERPSGSNIEDLLDFGRP